MGTNDTNGNAESSDSWKQIWDDLRLQAWLAMAELRNPSLKTGPVRDEVDALARVRDQLLEQLHRGKLAAKDEFLRAEGDWKKLGELLAKGLDKAEDSVNEALRRIRHAYDKESPRPPSPEE